MVSTTLKRKFEDFNVDNTLNKKLKIEKEKEFDYMDIEFESILFTPFEYNCKCAYKCAYKCTSE